MRRVMLLATLVFLSASAAAEGQARPLAGVGLSSPIGDFGDAAESGWHAMAGLQLGVPIVPIALRADGWYHSFGEATPSPSSSMLSGALSLVVTLPGVGLVPYVLGGIGKHRTSYDADNVDASSDNGWHGAFGVNIGALGFGGFGEVRLVSVSAPGGNARFVTATLGLRL